MTDITRAVAIRRALRNLEPLSKTTIGDFSGEAAIELELARAYDAGHVAGSGVKNQTDAEQHLAEVIRELPDRTVIAIGTLVSLELLDAIEAVRPKGDAEDTEAEDFNIGDEL